MTVTIKGYTTVSGKPEAILQLMQDARILDNLDGDDYINSIKETAWRCFGIGLQVTGDTYAERAESLLREMAKHNMITIKEEN